MKGAPFRSNCFEELPLRGPRAASVSAQLPRRDRPATAFMSFHIAELSGVAIEQWFISLRRAGQVKPRAHSLAGGRTSPARAASSLKRRARARDREWPAAAASATLFRAAIEPARAHPMRSPADPKTAPDATRGNG